MKEMRKRSGRQGRKGGVGELEQIEEEGRKVNGEAELALRAIGSKELFEGVNFTLCCFIGVDIVCFCRFVLLLFLRYDVGVKDYTCMYAAGETDLFHLDGVKKLGFFSYMYFHNPAVANR